MIEQLFANPLFLVLVGVLAATIHALLWLLIGAALKR